MSAGLEHLYDPLAIGFVESMRPVDRALFEGCPDVGYINYWADDPMRFGRQVSEGNLIALRVLHEAIVQREVPTLDFRDSIKVGDQSRMDPVISTVNAWLRRAGNFNPMDGALPAYVDAIQWVEAEADKSTQRRDLQAANLVADLKHDLSTVVGLQGLDEYGAIAAGDALEFFSSRTQTPQQLDFTEPRAAYEALTASLQIEVLASNRDQEREILVELAEDTIRKIEVVTKRLKDEPKLHVSGFMGDVGEIANYVRMERLRRGSQAHIIDICPIRVESSSAHKPFLVEPEPIGYNEHQYNRNADMASTALTRDGSVIRHFVQVKLTKAKHHGGDTVDVGQDITYEQVSIAQVIKGFSRKVDDVEVMTRHNNPDRKLRAVKSYLEQQVTIIELTD